MKTKLLLSFTLAAGLLAICGPALAHHGSAAYADKLVEFKQATVTKFLWSNPHSLLDFDVKDDKGNVVHWVGETGVPSALALIGWYQDFRTARGRNHCLHLPRQIGQPCRASQ